MKKNVSIVMVVVVCAVGFVIGGIAYTLHSANSLSYLSNDSKACNNCHVMNEVYADFNKSPHKNIQCIDCHLPHQFTKKWLAKAQTGLGHAYHFTFDTQLPTHFSANASTKKWAQENCIRCHSQYARNAINATTNKTHTSQSLDCVSCHKNVGHIRSF